jgi:hypothetical protein
MQKARFKANIPEERLAELEREIDRRIEERKGELGDVESAETEAIGNLLDYGRPAAGGCGSENISYDHYNARKFVKIFPEPDVAAGERSPNVVVRFYHKVVRRLLRQQIVFNQSVLGVLDEQEKRLAELERKLEDLKKRSPEDERPS